MTAILVFITCGLIINGLIRSFQLPTSTDLAMTNAPLSQFRPTFVAQEREVRNTLTADYQRSHAITPEPTSTAGAGVLNSTQIGGSLTAFHERPRSATPILSTPYPSRTPYPSATPIVGLVITERHGTETQAANALLTAGITATRTPRRTPQPPTPTLQPSLLSEVLHELGWANRFSQGTLWIVVAWLGLIGLLALAVNALDDYATEAIRGATMRGEGLSPAQQSRIHRLFALASISFVGLWVFFFVALLLIFVAALLHIDRTVYLSLIIIAAVFGTILSLARPSPYIPLSPKLKFGGSLPGDPQTINRQREPELWKMVDACSTLMGTQPLTSIYLRSDAAVFGKAIAATWLDAFRGRGDLWLEIGLAALGHLTEDQIKALVCHDYVYTRFTAARITYNLTLRFTHMLRMFELRFRASGQARYLHPMYWLHIPMVRIFERMAAGAGRFRAITADRAVAETLGANLVAFTFERSLYVSILVSLQTQQHIAEYDRTLQHFDNLYTLPLDPLIERQALGILNAEMKRPTQRLSVLPGPTDRITLLRPLLRPNVTIETGSALYLLEHPGAWQTGLTRLVEKQLQAARANAKPVERINYGNFRDSSFPKKDEST